MGYTLYQTQSFFKSRLIKYTVTMEHSTDKPTPHLIHLSESTVAVWLIWLNILIVF